MKTGVVSEFWVDSDVETKKDHMLFNLITNDP